MKEAEENKLDELEQMARELEPDPNIRKKTAQEVLSYFERFLDELPDQRAFYSDAGDGEGIEGAEAFPDSTPLKLDRILELLENEVDTPGLNAASGGHMGYIPGGGVPFAAFGDLLAAVANRYAGVHFASPGAVRMEQMLVRWMVRLIGLPEDTAGGNLSSGGSIANLTGIVTAREAKGIEPEEIRNTVIYASPHAHHCLDKAFRIAGLKHAVRREIPLDDGFRMDVDALEERIEKDISEGLDPWMIVASAGTTDTGAVDPLGRIAGIADEKKLWFHCDAAYGGFFMLTEEGKHKLKGIEKADSVVLDPHKGLFLPYGSGAVLIRDRMLMKKAFTYEADYMQDAKDPSGIISPAEVSPELTKHFRGLRMWLPLKIHGLSPFKAASEEKLLLARLFHQELQRVPGIEADMEPELSVVIFRVNAKGIDPNEATEVLNLKLREEGRVFFSSTRLDGKVFLRAAILSFRTHKNTIDLAIERVKVKTREILEEAKK